MTFYSFNFRTRQQIRHLPGGLALAGGGAHQAVGILGQYVK